jgi:hypothetical protein
MPSAVSTTRYNGQPGTSDAALYTSSGVTTVNQIVAYNGTGTDRTLTLKVVRNLTANQESLCTALTVPAGKALTILDRRLSTYNEIVFEDGDALHGLASAASAVNVLAF